MLMDVVRRFSESGERERLASALAQLADATRRHNLREAELLKDIVPKVDAWGDARKEIMDEEHIKEHEALWEGLIDAGTAEDRKTQSHRVHALLERMAEHMAKEEWAFLNADVLRDDAVVLDAFGG